MGIKCFRLITLSIVALSLLFVLPAESLCSNTDREFNFLTEFAGVESKYILYVSTPRSIYEYYKKMDHATYGMEFFSRFVTPELFASVAQRIRSITNNSLDSDESFANLVLDFIHQVPYNKSKVKFPIETLVDNYGDCDSLSVLAASIMKAGGLDVVLLYYEGSPVSHMNVGIYLPNKPRYNLSEEDPFFYEYEGKEYFVAETTGESWELGNQPDNYINSVPKIIPVKNEDDSFIGVISSHLDEPLIPSNISLNVTPVTINDKISGRMQLSGSISPRLPKQDIIIIIDHESKSESVIQVVSTDEFGNYNLTWNFDEIGKYTVQSTWTGYQNYSGSDSTKISLNIGLSFLLEPHELKEIVSVGSTLFELPTLDPDGNRILGDQKIKTILNEDFNETNFSVNTDFIIFGNEEPYLTEHKIITRGFEKESLRNNEFITKIVPEQEIVIKNYRDRMHSNMMLVFSHNQNSTNFKILILDNSDMQQITEEFTSNIINASNIIKENVEYVIKSSFFEDQLIFELFNEKELCFNETLNIDSSKEAEIRIIMKYDPDSIILLNNFEQVNHEKIYFGNDLVPSSEDVVTQKLPQYKEPSVTTSINENENNATGEIFTPILFVLMTLVTICCPIIYLFLKRLKRTCKPKRS